VLFEGDSKLIGTFVYLKIIEAQTWLLRGEQVPTIKGAINHE
jgi:hypothetical protein